MISLFANDGCLFAVGNGAHRKLRLARHSNLAYKHQVKGGVERRGDFRCNTGTPPRGSARTTGWQALYLTRALASRRPAWIRF